MQTGSFRAAAAVAAAALAAGAGPEQVPYQGGDVQRQLHQWHKNLKVHYVGAVGGGRDQGRCQAVGAHGVGPCLVLAAKRECRAHHRMPVRGTQRHDAPLAACGRRGAVLIV